MENHRKSHPKHIGGRPKYIGGVQNHFSMSENVWLCTKKVGYAFKSKHVHIFYRTVTPLNYVLPIVVGNEQPW